MTDSNENYQRNLGSKENQIATAISAILECSKKASISLQNCFLDIDKSLATYSLPATCNVFPVAMPGIFAQMQG